MAVGDTGAPGSTLTAAVSAFEDILDTEDTPQEKTQERTPKQAKPDTATEEAHQSEPEDEEGEAQSDEEPEADEAKASDEEGDEEGDDDEGEASDDDEAQEPVYEVRIAGQSVEVPLSELVKGYSRTADYTRKAQGLAKERTEFQAEVQQARVLREQYAQRLQQVEQLLQQSEPQVNWDQLRAEDPIEFAAQWADHQRRGQAKQQVQAEQSQILQRQRQEQEAFQAQQLERGRADLIRDIPAWKDPKVAKSEREAMKETGRGLGYSDEELASIMDPRAVVLLRMAHKYQELVQKRALLKPVRTTKAPVLRPGPVAPQKATRQVGELTRAKQSHAKAGTVKSAAALFEKLL